MVKFYKQGRHSRPIHQGCQDSTRKPVPGTSARVLQFFFRHGSLNPLAECSKSEGDSGITLLVASRSVLATCMSEIPE